MPTPEYGTTDTITISREQYRELLGARYLQTWVEQHLIDGYIDANKLVDGLMRAYRTSLSFADEAVAR